jgi:hypothetical protein
VRRDAKTKSFGDRGQRETVGKPSKKQRTSWQTFVDSLSILCDHGKGGETVAAIAVEKESAPGGNATFWIVVNHEKPKRSPDLRARDHLIEILQKLQQTTRKGEAVEEIMFHIFNESVRKAKDRVNNYRRKLQGLIVNLKQGPADLSLEGECLQKNS